MKKIIALGISIVLLVSAFVLLPQQRHEDVVAGPAGGTDAKIENLTELRYALMAMSGYGEDIKSGTIHFEYSNNIAQTKSDSIMNEIENEAGNYIPDVEEDDGVYYQAALSTSTTGGQSASGETAPNFGYGTGITIGSDGIGSGATIDTDGFGSGATVDTGISIPGDINIESRPVYDIETDEFGNPILPDGVVIPDGSLETDENGNIVIPDDIYDDIEDKYESDINDGINNAISSLSLGLETSQIKLTLYFNENVTYAKINATYARRMGDGDNRKVLTYVYDIELYSKANTDDPTQGTDLIRFNFFDGYSNDSEVTPVITSDKLGIWYEIGEDQLEYTSFFTETFFASYMSSMQMIGSSLLEANESEDIFSYYSSMGESSVSFDIDLTRAEAPEIKQHGNSSTKNYVGGYIEEVRNDMTISLANMNNTKVEFDLNSVEVGGTDDFDWTMFDNIISFGTEVDGGEQ